jgi:hypothetical protein
VFTNLDFAHSFSKQGAWNEAELNSDSLFLVNVFTLWLIEKKAPFTYGSLPPWYALYNHCAPLYWRACPPYPRVCPSNSVRSPYTLVYALSIGVRAFPITCAPPSQACVPSPHGCVPPVDVHALPPQECAPFPHVCAPSNSRARPPHGGVRALPPQACAPSPPPCVPPRRRGRPARSRAHLAPTNTRAFIAGGRIRYIRRGPSHPHFTTLGFVSWNSFLGSLHEVVGMVQDFRFLPF